MSTGALEGIRVFDCTQHLMAPLATAILGDLGAEIIKVEHPVRGDPSRGFIRLNEDSTGVGGRNAYFEHCNRNKKSITGFRRVCHAVDFRNNHRCGDCRRG